MIACRVDASQSPVRNRGRVTDRFPTPDSRLILWTWKRRILSSVWSAMELPIVRPTPLTKGLSPAMSSHTSARTATTDWTWFSRLKESPQTAPAGNLPRQPQPPGRVSS